MINETAVTIAAMITGKPSETVHRWIETALRGNQIFPGAIRWNAWIAYRAACAGHNQGYEECMKVVAKSTFPYLQEMPSDDSHEFFLWWKKQATIKQ